MDTKMAQSQVIFDGLVYGVRALIAHIRIMFFSMMIYVAALMAFLFGSVIVLVRVGSLDWVKLKQLPLIPFLRHVIADYALVLLCMAAVFLLLFTWMRISYIRITLAIKDTGSASLNLLIPSPRLLFKAALADLLFLIILVLCFMCLVVPAIYWLINYGFFMWFIVDQDAGIIESFVKSRRMVQGYGWHILALTALVIIIMSAPAPYGWMVGATIASFSCTYIYRTLQS